MFEQFQSTMDRFVKRKNVNTLEKDRIKSPKKENCPHNERCYRRNPHHFKEYDHAHLNEIIKGEDPPVIPSSWPQPKNIYFEQIEIMKSLLQAKSKPNMQNPSNQEAQTSKTPMKQAARSTSDFSKPGSSRTKTNVSRSSSTPIIALDNSKGTMMEKLERASPYNIFFTTIIKAPQTTKQPNAITFTDLLCPSLGVLTNSLQINFMIDIDWLMKQYKARGLSSQPMTMLFGYDWPDMAKFMDMFCPNVKYKLIKTKDPFGVHHSKIGIYIYEDKSLRVVVSTANLYYEDWNHYNQGLWLSPSCPQLSDSCSHNGESPTGFKEHLLNYLNEYDEALLEPFINIVENADFSSVRVFFTYSFPGKHYPDTNGCHQHVMAHLLSAHCRLPQKTSAEAEGPLSWPIMAQASSIGSMGKLPEDWLTGHFLVSLACHNKMQRPLRSKGIKPSASKATLSIVYPSVDNVMRGYFGAESGGCLPYSKTVNEKQRWLQKYMHQWKAESFGRSRAMPHIKTYCRVSPCLSKLAYFLITSANLSKAAWGTPLDVRNGSYVRSHEAGVLFLPKFFDEDYFQINNTSNETGRKMFPFMYDLPLTPYKDDDYPWCN